MAVAIIEHTTYAESVAAAFMAADGPSVFADDRPVLLKPNLVNASAFPVTTHPDFVAAVITVVREYTDAPMVVAEGCGDASMETNEVFAELGYVEMAERNKVALLDLNHAPLARRTNPECSIFPEMWLPEVAFTHCIISLPVLKRHSFLALMKKFS